MTELSPERGSNHEASVFPASFRDVDVSNYRLLSREQAEALLEQAGYAVVDSQQEKAAMIRRNRELNTIEADAERAIRILQVYVDNMAHEPEAISPAAKARERQRAEAFDGNPHTKDDLDKE